MAPEANYVEVLSDGLLSLPQESYEKMGLRAGMKLKLVLDNEGLLLLKRSEEDAKETRSQVSEASLRAQQSALAKIWGDPEEDIYSDAGV